jgi:imidazolonepropionase-like amidohydrolase
MKKLCMAILAVTCLASRAETVLIKGAVVHSATGAGSAMKQLLIRDRKIAAIETTVSGKFDRVVNLEGHHLYPGLIAATTTLGLVEIDAVRATRDHSEVGEFHADVQSWVSVNPDSELLPVARANGITHIVPVPGGGIVSGVSGVLALDGWTSEQMLVKAPAALHLFWPRMDLDTTPRELARDKNRWKSLEEQARERTKRLRSIDDFFLEAAAYGKAREKLGDAGMNPAWEAMLPYVRKEIPVVVHADEFREIKTALGWAKTNQHTMIIAGGRDAWMLAKELAEQKVPVIFERIYNESSGSAPTSARDDQPYDVHYKAPGILAKAGVKVIMSEGLGGDSAANVRNLPYSTAQAIAFGLPEDEALKAITLYPAEVFKVSDRLGSLEVGKEASIVATDGSIFDIRSRVNRVWIAGKEVTLESRHTRLFDRYRKRLQ